MKCAVNLWGERDGKWNRGQEEQDGTGEVNRRTGPPLVTTANKRAKLANSFTEPN